MLLDIKKIFGTYDEPLSPQRWNWISPKKISGRQCRARWRRASLQRFRADA